MLERSAQRKMLLLEIRSTNAALTIAHTIWMGALSLKQQYVKNLRDEHRRHQELYEAHTSRREGSIDSPSEYLTIRANLIVVVAPLLPIQLLQSHTFEKISITGRALLLTTAIAQAADYLASSMHRRNEIVGELLRDNISGQELLNRYLGLETSAGSKNSEYPQTIQQIYEMTDDLLACSELLANELHQHGLSMFKQLPPRIRNDLPPIVLPDLEAMRRDGWAPAEAAYAPWTSVRG